MEIIRKENSGLMGVIGVALLALGAALLGWSLWMLPPAPAYGFPWAFAGAVAAFLPIAAAGWCLGAIVLRRRDSSYPYGHDGYDGSGGTIPFALVVIAAGVMLLSFNSGMLPIVWRRVFFSWQMLILVIAMSEMARGRFIGGGVALAVGGFFIIGRLGRLYPEIEASGAASSFWPILLVIAGILILGSVLFKPCRKGKCGCHVMRDPASENRRCQSGKGTRASGVIDIAVIFGGSEQVYLDPEFSGGRIGTIFGGVKLDLRRTGLPEGETYLKIDTVFGGVEIDAPEEWMIEIRNDSVFGGFFDKRLPAVNPGYTDGRKLVIHASSVFGGGEIK